MQEQIWKKIDGYDDYFISNLGNIKSIKFGKTNYMALSEDKDGYFKVNLYKNGKSNVAYIHRLVAKTFISNPNNYKIVNHKDENKQNNNALNLEWCTSKYNNNYGTRYFKNNRKKYICEALNLLKKVESKDEKLGKAINLLEKLK